MIEDFTKLGGAFARNAASPAFVFIRLLAALALGSAVAWIYRHAHGHEDRRIFSHTLILIAVLIAMVTQVIGDSVARAFSLVGALSIVRFRTIVRDSRDTAYVMFAVVVGMAVGSQNLWAACLGLLVAGSAALLLARKEGGFALAAAPEPALILSVRIGLGYDAGKLLGATLNAHLDEPKTASVTTAKQGAALQVTYEARLRAGASAFELVSALNQLEGVQDVRLVRRGFAE